MFIIKKFYLIMSLIPCIMYQIVYPSGYSGLKLFFGTKATALGENLVSLPNNIENIYYNPAGLFGINPLEIKVMYLSWLADINRSDIILAKSLKSGSVIGISASYLWTQLESETGSFNYFSLLSDIVYAKKFEKLYIGFGTTIAYEGTSLDSSYNLAGGLNFGIILRKQRLNLGLSVKNLGQSFVSIANTNEVMPTNFNFGLSYIMYASVLTGNIKYDLDGNISSHVGLELSIYKGVREEIVVRVGNVMKLNNSTDLEVISNFRSGIGFRKEGLVVDYCLIPLGSDIGIFHYISVGFMFY